MLLPFFSAFSQCIQYILKISERLSALFSWDVVSNQQQYLIFTFPDYITLKDIGMVSYNKVIEIFDNITDKIMKLLVVPLVLCSNVFLGRL